MKRNWFRLVSYKTRGHLSERCAIINCKANSNSNSNPFPSPKPNHNRRWKKRNAYSIYRDLWSICRLNTPTLTLTLSLSLSLTLTLTLTGSMKYLQAEHVFWIGFGWYFNCATNTVLVHILDHLWSYKYGFGSHFGSFMELQIRFWFTFGSFMELRLWEESRECEGQGYNQVVVVVLPIRMSPIRVSVKVSVSVTVGLGLIKRPTQRIVGVG